jgi:hypothetical protein
MRISRISRNLQVRVPNQLRNEANDIEIVEDSLP